MRFGSVCSGIEAASVAWAPLGWKAAWLSEIEPFPCAVLAHHYPDVPNLGDMTALPDRIASGEVEAPDVFCGGTPCQAFSVAGLRKSLDDARGNLSLTFCEIANAIDTVRADRGDEPAIIFWENVPGVLSTKDNAFGCFLAGLAGEELPLLPPGGKWTNAGCVLGPQRAVAWRVLDAQYFGVAQRRRRVFVVASAREGFDLAAVLFEFDGVRRDSAPSREAGEGAAVCPTLRAGGNSTGGDRPPGTDVDTADSLQVVPHTAQCLTTGTGQRYDPETETIVPHAVTHRLRGEGFDASEDGTGRGTPLVPVSFAIQAGALRTNPASGPDGVGVQSGHAYTLEARAEVQAIAFHPTQDPISSTDGSTHALGCGSPGGQASIAVAVALRGREGGATAELGDEVQNCLRASSGGGDKPHVLAPVRYGGHQQDTLHHEDGIMSTLPGGSNNNVGHYTATVQAMQVRRLTPVECEALQGFPKNYTAIPWRNKPADQCPDGPRYKALGNSWAVPNVRWIGQRIANAIKGFA